jgi:dTDP-4-amino-4,6-dideoxygalactose transaminase
MSEEHTLAIRGGPKTKTSSYGSGKRFSEQELAYLKEALDQNTLFYGMGNLVKRACAKMQGYTGLPYVVASSSGSAAVHLGLIACGIGPGDEVIVTPNTDSGSVLGIIEEGAVPVFCDCAETLQPTAETVAACITPRTRAVVVVHLAGNPAPVDDIVALCNRSGIGVVEDCAQSWGTRLHGRIVGSFGTAAAYSTNDFKHISTGDGGFVALRDPQLYRRVANYADKHYDRLFDQTLAKAHHGLNYRMTELQGAVALAQLEKVEAITGRRHVMASLLAKKLEGLDGIRLVPVIPGGYSTLWFAVLLVDPTLLTVDRDHLVTAILAEGVEGLGSYKKYDLISTPLFRHRVVRPWLEDARRSYPFVQPDGRNYTYALSQTPTHKRLLETGMMLNIGSFYTDQDIIETADAIRKVIGVYRK